MKKKKSVILPIIMTLVCIVYIYLVKNFDVRNIGPNNTSVGFGAINEFFKNILGSNMTIYKITEFFGYLVFIVVGFYAMTGFIQMIKRKNPFKIDNEIISVGILYVMMITVYVLFEKIIINYRPIIIDGELEASFPSSHTILAICTCVSSIMISKKYVATKLVYPVNLVTLIIMLVVFLGRFISGVHWFSDIVGGIIVSITLLTYFRYILYILNKRKKA